MANNTGTWTNEDLKGDDRQRGPSDSEIRARNEAVHLDAHALEIMREIPLLSKAEALQLAKIRRG